MLTGAQIRAARALVRMEQAELAERAEVSAQTVKRLERMDGAISANTGTEAAIRRALSAAGVIFIEENGEGPGVRLRKAPAQPDMRPVSLKDGAGYYVLVGWPAGQEEQVDGFATEAEAERWIAESASWVARHPRSRSS